MSQDRNARAQDAGPEPLSPELALVDPDLATRAREQLGNAGSVGLTRTREADARKPRPEDSDDRELMPPIAPAHEPNGRAPFQSRPSLPARSLRTLVGLAAAALAVVGAITAVRSSSDESPVPAVNAASAGTKTRDAAVKRAVHRAKSARPRGAAPTTHTFVWPKVQGASSYQIEFFTSGRKVFEASLTGRRLDLPSRWRYKGRWIRLVPGTYQWQVRAAFGDSPTSLGKPIMRNTWIVR